MPVQVLLGTITSGELTEWMAFDRVEPFGALRGDYQAALVAATIANGFRSGKGKRLSVEDFLLNFGGEAKQAVVDRWDEESPDDGEAYSGDSTEAQVRAMRAMLWGDVDASRTAAASGGDIEADDRSG